tara:strand:+ start:343 stop:1251 length:909 start_codon:yes stop_codon:yes gene_type:complete
MIISSDIKNITIISVSYKSGIHLRRLFKNLYDKAENKQKLKFLVIDNTNGADQELNTLLPRYLNISIVKNDGSYSQRSISHASGLDVGLKQSRTEYSLIIDPDVHVFKSNWDSLCLSYLDGSKNLVIGAPYPDWKLGKVHDYPSVVFMFFRTQEIRRLNKSFQPFPAPLKRMKNSLFRKVTRLGFIASKSRLNKSQFLRIITTYLEKILGITSPDTGNDIIEAIRNKEYESINFEACLVHQLGSFNTNSYHYNMAREFELYYQGEDPFMTHMYGSGVFHWKTAKGSDVQYWQELIENIERGA